MSNTSKPSRNRKIGALVAYTTLACSLVSLGVYVYRRQQKKSTNPRTHDANGSDRNSRQSAQNGTTQNNGRSAEGSSLSRLGSKIARTVKKNRKVMTISLKNTIVWNPSPDPTAPNYGFVEGAIPLLFHLAESYNLHLILLCPPLQQARDKGKERERELTLQEQDESKRQQKLGQQRERDQILAMLTNAGLTSAAGGPKVIDPRQLLICETEEGVSHVVRHLESQVHVEAVPSVVELVQGVVPKVVVVQKKMGHSRAPSSTAFAGQEEEVVTRSHVRVRSSSGSSSSTESRGSEEHPQHGTTVNGAMGESYVEVTKSEPLVSGYVTQAGKKGYVEVTDQIMRSSLNPEYSN
ncbi:hypothetical protein BG004_003641 [Podila humilis]|nr:hypothetical protein BG004_003641 [Podila humilis]